MNPANELVKGSDEAFCLAEAGSQYVIYAPNGGKVCLNTVGIRGKLAMHWLDPRNGERQELVEAETIWPLFVDAPTADDWVLIARASEA